jgi:two-component system cell cycle sensor histidine kinase/response regulator CckA
MEAIGTLAGGVAHDLNNTLSGIISYPELLLLDLPEGSRLHKPLQLIRRAGQDAAAIVQDLLTMARRGVAVTEIQNINTIVSNQLASPEFLQMLHHHSNVKLKIDIDHDVRNIKGSGPHLAKSVMNLINNAAESMPEGGTISISTADVSLSQSYQGYERVVEGEYITITVADEGVGISEDEMTHIFEPFFTKKKMGRSGSGLGMSVVYGTVKDHLGFIDIASEPGRGSIFTLYFPVTDDIESKDIVPFSLDTLMGEKQTILIVDDSAAQREIAQTILKRLNYSVATVSSGEEAVNYVQETATDLLVLDMIMDPGIDGLETYRRISTFKPNQKIVVVSGFSETASVNALLQQSGGKYLKKPYTIEQLGRAVRKSLKQ